MDCFNLKKGRSLAKILFGIARHIHMHGARTMEHLEIGRAQVPFLMTISKHEGISQEELSRHLVIDRATTAKSVQKLVTTGFVERKQKENDRRSYSLFLTPKGEKLQPEILQMAEELSVILTRGFSAEEEELSKNLLFRMFENIYHEVHSGTTELNK